MSDLYRVACKFERTRIVAHLDHVVHGGCWRVDDCRKTDIPPFRIWRLWKYLYITTTKPFKRGSYISPKKELRPYITPKEIKPELSPQMEEAMKYIDDNFFKDCR